MLKRISDLTGTWLPAIVLAAAAVAFAAPSTFAPLGTAVPYLLMMPDTASRAPSTWSRCSRSA
jgi:hypothetical protein